jgi:glycosyltransferase involved in cell wall biosynthesis
MNEMKDKIRALKYRLKPQFRSTLDANPDYEQTVKAFTRSAAHLPDSYEIRGWALYSESPVTLCWSYNNETLFELSPWMPREDVQKAFSFIRHSLNTGFRFNIPTEILSSAATGKLKLEAKTDSKTFLLWKNSFAGQESSIEVNTALANWKESIANKHDILSSKERITLDTDQAIFLCRDRLALQNDPCKKLLSFIGVDSEPAIVLLKDIERVAAATQDVHSERPILIESTELLEQAFLLRYLVGGVVHILGDDDGTKALATRWNSQGVASNPVSELADTAAGLSVIIPVYNALDVTTRCLKSLLPCLNESDEVLIVSDASDRHVNEQLQAFAENHKHFTFIERTENGGFVEACWTGYEASSSKNDIILLNSDTLLAPDSLESFKQQMYIRQAVAMGSPMSTGSPNFELHLSPGEDFFAGARRLKQLQAKEPFSAITPEGQCLYIKRWALERFGFLDKIYGRGFCEESDLAMRMFAGGAELICLSNDLIHHERSASFGSYQRSKQIRKNRPIFDERWGNTYSIAFSAFKQRTHLAKLRNKWHTSKPQNSIDTLEVAFMLPELITAGGHLSVIQHVNEMICRGRKAGIITHKAPTTEALGLLTTPLVFSLEELETCKKLPPHLIATMWSTAHTVHDLAKANPSVTAWYYIQDYEPWFYDRSDQEQDKAAAARSYDLDINMVAKTDFLCSLVEKLHGRKVSKVCPGIARDIFYPGAQTQHHGTPRVAALYRPDKSRRGTQLLLQVLDELLTQNSNVEISLFGSSDIEACHPSLRKHIHFLGPLPSNKVADTYRNSDVVCDLSLWHGFGRMGIEAMACGAVPLLSESGGINEYAIHEKNALIVSDKPDEVAASLNRLLQDDVYRHTLRQAGLNCFKWSEQQATTDWLELLASKSKKDKAA